MLFFYTILKNKIDHSRANNLFIYFICFINLFLRTSSEVPPYLSVTLFEESSDLSGFFIVLFEGYLTVARNQLAIGSVNRQAMGSTMPGTPDRSLLPSYHIQNNPYCNALTRGTIWNLPALCRPLVTEPIVSWGQAFFYQITLDLKICTVSESVSSRMGH